MEHESITTVRIGKEVICMAALLTFVVLITIFSRYWFKKVEHYSDTADFIGEEADVYKLEAIGRISGVDVVEFILKYDSYYDYYIVTKSSALSLGSARQKYDPDIEANAISCDVKITKDRYNSLIKSNNARNEQLAATLWSEDYLVYDVFGSQITDDYYVCPIRSNESTYAYVFIRAAN